ncbi:Hypothetical protein CINCED_3A000897 [Cinara cedri]|nr:Hypothetical protein CINCED_3A000897 [Cinara cedri]
MFEENIQIKDVRICQEHFENKMFLNILTKNRLTFNAIPTLFNDDILAKRAAYTILDLSKPLICSSPSLSVSSSPSSTQTTLHLSNETPGELELKMPVNVSNSSTQTPLPLSNETPRELELMMPDNISNSSTQTPSHLSDASPRELELKMPVNSSTSSTQTTLHLSNATPRELKLKKKLGLAKDHIKTLENKLYLLNHLDSEESFLKQCQKFLSPDLILVIKSHLKQKERKEGGIDTTEKIVKKKRKLATLQH